MTSLWFGHGGAAHMLEHSKPSLYEIYERYSDFSDKGTRHTYISFYNTALARYRNKRVTLVEVGVHLGGSLGMWSEYFDFGHIIGIDVCDTHVVPLSDRTELIVGNACHIQPFEADIVIDDGSHTLVDQLEVFVRFFPLVSIGGLYVIEDIQSDAAMDKLLSVHDFKVVDMRSDLAYDNVILYTTK